MYVNPDRFLSIEQIEQFVKEHNIDYAYCIECGALICDSKEIFMTRDGKRLIDRRESSNTFLKSRVYGNTEYHLCRCKECVAKKFPNILKSKGLYAQKWAKCCKYAYGVSDEDFDEYSSNRQKITKDKMINKYGEEEGTKRWEEYCNKQSVTNTFEYKQEKYGWNREEFDKYNASRSVTLENCISKHGEKIGRKIYNDYVNKQRYTTTLEYFIEKYGEEIGTEKFNNFDDLRMSSNTYGGYSMSSKELFDTLKTRDDFKEHQLYYADTEYKVNINNQHNFRLDFYDEDINLAIEFQGVIYHRDKRDDDIIRMMYIQDKLDNFAIFVDDIAYYAGKYKISTMICNFTKRMLKHPDEYKHKIVHIYLTEDKQITHSII